MSICIKCGTRNPPEAEYCFKCGARIYRDYQAAEPAGVKTFAEPSHDVAPKQAQANVNGASESSESRPTKMIIYHTQGEMDNYAVAHYLMGAIVAIGTLYLLFGFQMEVQSTDYFHLISDEMTLYDYLCERDLQLIAYIGIVLMVIEFFTVLPALSLLLSSSPIVLGTILLNDNILPGIDMELTNGGAFLTIFIILYLLIFVRAYIFDKNFLTKFRMRRWLIEKPIESECSIPPKKTLQFSRISIPIGPR